MMKKELEVSILWLMNVFAIIFAWVLEIIFKMEPCSLCLLQRFGIYISLLVLTIYWVFNYFKNIKPINIVILTLSWIGIFFSLVSGLRQTYIQLLPLDKVPSCGADLNTLLQIVTPLEAIKKVFQGSGECADKAFIFLNLSLANWATILFLILLLINTIIIIKKFKN